MSNNIPYFSDLANFLFKQLRRRSFFSRNRQAEPMRILATGHSHLTALEQAWTKGHCSHSNVDFRFLQLWGRYEPLKIGETFNPQLIADLQMEIADLRPDAIVTSLVGSENFQLAFNSPDRPFDFLSHGVASIDIGTELVPLSLVREKLREIDGYIALVHEIAMLSGVPVLYPLPPPPLSDLDAQREMLEPRLRDAFQGLPLPSASLQMRLWIEMCEGIKAVCASGSQSARIISISPPAGALDSEGFLLTARARDYVHADAIYGGMVLDQIISILNGPTNASSL